MSRTLIAGGVVLAAATVAACIVVDGKREADAPGKPKPESMGTSPDGRPMWKQLEFTGSDGQQGVAALSEHSHGQFEGLRGAVRAAREAAGDQVITFADLTPRGKNATVGYEVWDLHGATRAGMESGKVTEHGTMSVAYEVAGRFYRTPDGNALGKPTTIERVSPRDVIDPWG